MTLQQKGQSPSAPSNLAEESLLSVPLLKCVLSPKKYLRLDRNKGKQITLSGEDLAFCLAKLRVALGLGRLFEKKVTKQNLQRTITTTKKPNEPKAVAQQQVLPPSVSFLKSYLLSQLTQGNLSKRS